MNNPFEPLASLPAGEIRLVAASLEDLQRYFQDYVPTSVETKEYKHKLKNGVEVKLTFVHFPKVVFVGHEIRPQRRISPTAFERELRDWNDSTLAFEGRRSGFDFERASCITTGNEWIIFFIPQE